MPGLLVEEPLGSGVPPGAIGGRLQEPTQPCRLFGGDADPVVAGFEKE
jgi:hypothetical protein